MPPNTNILPPKRLQNIEPPGRVDPRLHTGAAREVTGELIDPRIADVEAVARWLDYAFVLPGGFRFGVAGIVGLIPGFGDLVDSLISLYIVLRAISLGVPRVTVTRMLVNVAIEAVAGTVPLLGDLFDIAFKANRRNYQLLRNHMFQPARQRANDRVFVIFAALVVIASIALPVVAIVEILHHL